MASTIKVDNIQDQDGNNIINENANTITIGASGDTVTLASGAKLSGIGTVSWQTSIKTSGFTAVSGEGYFVNTTSGAITVTLPASPSAGDIVSVKDYAQTFDTNACTIGRNSQPIEGQTFDLTLDTEGTAITLIYGDATKGWQSVNSNEVTNAAKFVTATGGTITTSGNFKIHTFTGPGTFCVSCGGNPAGSSTVDYLVVAGGGSGGTSASGGDNGAGGGAGGYRESSGAASGCYSASPLGSGVSALPVTSQGYPITVGGGGAGVTYVLSPEAARVGNDGSNSIFSTITSTGGGGGGGGPGGIGAPFAAGRSGGSGGGGSSVGGAGGTPGAGNTPPVSPPQGQNGGSGASDNATYRVAGGGGGAGAVGGTVSNPAPAAGPGGAGVTSSINGTPTARAGGGGGGGHPGGSRTGGSGGSGGGGAGGFPGNQVAGTANTGGGGGGRGGCQPTTSAAGGSGIVIIRYKFQ